MIKVNVIEIAGFASALEALRLPFGLECRSEVDSTWSENYSCDEPIVGTLTKVKVSDKDLALLQTLVKRGDEHAKVLRGVVVYLDIDAPRFWWQVRLIPFCTGVFKEAEICDCKKYQTA